MSLNTEPFSEPAATPEASVEAPAPEATATPAAPAQQTETKEPAKIVKRKSIFSSFGRKKEEPKKEEQAEAKSDSEVTPESKPVEEAATAEKRKSKGLNMLFSRAKSASPQPTKTEEKAPEAATNSELPKIEHLEPIQPEAIVNQVNGDESNKSAEEGKTPNRSPSPFGKRFTNIFKFSKSNDKAEKEQQVKEGEPVADATVKDQESTPTDAADKPLPEVTAAPEETDKPLVAPPVSASA